MMFKLINFNNISRGLTPAYFRMSLCFKWSHNRTEPKLVPTSKDSLEKPKAVGSP